MAHSATLALTHIGLWVNDLPKMKEFYTGILGFVASDEGRINNTDYVFLSRDPREHHQVVLATGRPGDLSFNVVNQISFLVDSLATLRLLHAGLKDENVTQITPINHGNAVSVYFRDPDNNRTELYIHTPWHVTQPSGTPLDLAVSDAQLWRNVEAHARSLPGFMPRAQWEEILAARMAEARTKSRFWKMTQQ